MEKYFVTIHIDVQEQKEKQALNTPGGEELMKRLGGPSGLPFLAFLNGKGELIVNSLAPAKDGKKGGNIGHPDAPEEVDWFMEMVARSAPSMTKEERATLENWLRHQKK